ncbi:MAG: hypothetical protein OHK93_002696 [Ramalina farinacea]|uniref:Glycoside hydrolase family 43 protein n=1 Tax=Ramalina farinacea TaxID=258253 RepID=A0AA43QS28_9LECA|nr:hypothetical protein [Ramalina farinacea]
MFLKTITLLLAAASLSLQLPIQKRALSAGPVITSNFPDPAFLQLDGTYYAFSTTAGGLNIPMATSPDFSSWTVTGTDALPTLPSWGTGPTWAPDVSQLDDGTFVMYFAAVSTSDTSKHCVGTATSNTVTGPYTPSDTPFACPLDQGGAIDAAGFRDSDGTRYVVYKIDANSLGGGGICGNGDESHDTPLTLQQVGADGVTPVGSATTILSRGPADGPLIEAPSLVKAADGTYVLFFSSNCYNGPDYDVSYATAPSVTGPYTKSGAALLVSGDDGGMLNSPGGASVGIGGTQLVFHSDSVASNAAVRQMWTAGITISGTTVAIS